MRTASAQEIYERYVSSLPVPEQLRLLAMLAQRLAAEPSAAGLAGLSVGLPRRSITELHGLGNEIWEGIDAQNYVDQLRDEWEQQEQQEQQEHSSTSTSDEAR